MSFDNAVINAGVLKKMSAFWQRIFLTIGVLIAVFGMRLVFPVVIVSITAKIGPIEAVRLALNDKDRYQQLVTDAHPSIAAFGGMFLLMIFLNFIFEDREIKWLAWLERPLAKDRQGRHARGLHRTDRAAHRLRTVARTPINTVVNTRTRRRRCSRPASRA